MDLQRKSFGSLIVSEFEPQCTRWNMKKITLVWDRGFVSKPNVRYAREKKFHVLSAGPHTSDEVLDWITRYDDDEIERRENILSLSKENGVYCKENIGSLYGFECKIVVMLDSQKRNRSRVERDLLRQCHIIINFKN